MALALWEEAGDDAPGRPPHRHPYPHPHPHPRPSRRFRLDLHRHLWDAARSGELARRCGVAGVPVARPDDPSAGPYGGAWAVARWADEAELLARAEGRPPRGAFTVRLGARRRLVLELVAPDDSHAPAVRPVRERPAPQEIAALPVLPEAAARTLPDLELLRAGLITVDQLHPLVGAALGTSAAARAINSVPLRGSRGPADPHRVECRGAVHRIALRDGVLTAVDHDPVQLRREELLVALGGPPLPCLRAIDAVHRDPEALPAVRERLGHGDVAGALAVVEGLLGPAAVLRDGPLRDELERAAARRVEYGLFRAGLGDADANAGVGAGASGAAGAAGSGAGAARRGVAVRAEYAEPAHRPRIDRRTPLSARRKRENRDRPRTTLSR
jgi:hypothetical protein